MTSRVELFFFMLAFVVACLFCATASFAGELPTAATSSLPVVSSSDAGGTMIAANFPQFTRATTQIIVSISLNNTSRGDYFVELDDQGQIFVKVEDLVSLKLNIQKDRTVMIHNEAYAPLSALQDVKYTFDQNNLTVSILGKTTEKEFTAIDVYPLQARPQNIYYPHETSAFLNYGLSYSYSDPYGFQALSLTNKVGARSGNVFFTSDSLFTKTETNEEFVRLQSSVTYERRSDLQWLVFGDQYANSGDLGSTANMGGIGFSKVYRTNPYFITQPVFNLQGVTAYPSQADIYLDGNLVSRQQIAPGTFDLKNIYSYAGSHNVDVVLRDPFGNEQRISYPLYFSTQLLREGLHEYSYNAGFLREQYGIESNDYGKAAFSAFHRYGVTSAFNVGARAEGTDGVYNGGLYTALAVPHFGAFTVSVAGSSAFGNKGSAASLQHSYQNGNFSTNLLYRQFSANYATISAPTTTDPVKYELSLGAGYSLAKWGGISLGYSESETYGGLNTRNTSASYSKSLSQAASLFLTATATRTENTTYSFFVGLNFNLDRIHHGSVQYNKTGNTDTETVQIQKDQPLGEGLGYQASLMRSDNGRASSYSFNPAFQYNARYGIYSANSSFQRSSVGASSEAYTLSAAGALVYAGGFYGITRPVSDSFTFVMVDSLAGADVLSNGSEMGKTDSSGTLIVPSLASYVDNQITVDTKNIPLDYTVSGVNTKISPSLWSGSCVAFDVQKVRAVTGTLSLQKAGKKIPLEYADITLTVGQKEVTFPTGQGGEFYMENSLPEEAKTIPTDKQSCRAIAERKKKGGNAIQPGTYPAKVEYAGGTCTFSVTFPKTDDPVIDVGQVECVAEKQPGPERVEKAAPAPAVVQPKPPVEQVKPSPAAVVPQADRAPRSFVMKIAFNQKGTPTTKQSRETLAYIVRQLKKDPSLVVEIEGHADRQGSEKAAERLALIGAERTKDYLIRSGVQPRQISRVVSMGRKQMICTDQTTVCDRINRRIVVRLVASSPLSEITSVTTGSTR